MDAEYARTTRFKRPIVHGMLVSSLLSSLLGTRVPGQGSVYVSQTLKFTAPVFVGEEVTATATVTKIDGKFVTLETIVRKAGDAPDSAVNVVEGEATAYVPHLPGKK